MTFSREDALGKRQQNIDASDGAIIQDVAQVTVSSPTANVHVGPAYIRSKQGELNDYLARAVAIYRGRLYQAVAQFSHPPSPYKLLSSFRIEDASIFCGRTSATKDLCTKVFQVRFLAIHAKSGAGKTSLLNAGLSPYVIRNNCLPLYVHNYDKDPVWVIKQTLAPAIFGEWPDGLQDISLHEFLTRVCNCLKQLDIKDLILILDQFEDFFLYRTQLSERLPFIKALGDCYSDQTLPIRIIISLRKDYYSDLTEFEDVIPHLYIYQNHYRPSAMTLQEVREAIVKPLKELDSSITYEPILLDTLLAELSRNQIELPLLQILCTRLYETLGKDKKRITLKMYEALGKTEGVLKSYLHEVLAGLPEKEESLAKEILKEFIRSDLTKQTLSANKLIARVKSTKNEIDRTLTCLVNARLLNRDNIEGETRYELVHEYLTTEIIKWVGTADREFKRAEELLRSELAIWRNYHDLISFERLELLHPYRERFKGLDTNEWECLLRSAIKAESDLGDEYPGSDVTDWVKVVRSIDPTILFKAIIEPLIIELQDKDSGIRRDAAKALALIGKDGDLRAVEPLIAELRNGNYWAAEALGKLGDTQAFEPLIDTLQSKDSTNRHWAAAGLGELGDVRAVEPLITALQDKNDILRRSAAEALGKLGNIGAFEPLIVALQDLNKGVRGSAAEALGKLGNIGAFEPLNDMLQDRDSKVRQQAIEALEKLGDTRAVEPLIGMLQDTDNEVRWQAVGALGELGNTRAVEPLIGMLQDKNCNVRICAVWALGNIADSDAVEPLIISLQDKESDVRQNAAWALGEIRDIRAIEPLILSLQDKDDEVREQARWALDNIKKIESI